MLATYRDLYGLTTDPPNWHDMNGVPRFKPFEPALSPNIYASEVVLLAVGCQECSRHFAVEMNRGHHERWSLREAVLDGTIHYGDPPRHGGDSRCLAGDTMNCWDWRVIEFWERHDFDWVRVPALEVWLDQPHLVYNEIAASPDGWALGGYRLLKWDCGCEVLWREWNGETESMNACEVHTE